MTAVVLQGMPCLCVSGWPKPSRGRQLPVLTIKTISTQQSLCTGRAVCTPPKGRGQRLSPLQLWRQCTGQLCTRHYTWPPTANPLLRAGCTGARTSKYCPAVNNGPSLVPETSTARRQQTAVQWRANAYGVLGLPCLANLKSAFPTVSTASVLITASGLSNWNVPCVIQPPPIRRTAPCPGPAVPADPRTMTTSQGQQHSTTTQFLAALLAAL